MKRISIGRWVSLAALLLAAGWGWQSLSVAAEANQGASANAPATQPANANSNQVMRDLLRQRQAPPVVEPTTQPHPAGTNRSPGSPQRPVLDPAILGVAPGEPAPKLRREGEFVVERRGRMIRSSSGGRELFVFQGDAKNSPEPPMILQACQLLETMENIVQQRGNGVPFIITGQVHTYRGANYLMPTMMKVAIDRGNLKQ